MFDVLVTIVYFGFLAAGHALSSSTRCKKPGTGISPPHPVLVNQVPSVIDALKANHQNSSWAHAVFTFCPAGERHSNKTEVHLGYSVENGKLVLEWSRFTRRNVADKDKIIAFIQKRHHTVLQQENRVRYFLVEGENMTQLGMQIMQEFYHLPSNGEIGLYATGFDWKRDDT